MCIDCDSVDVHKESVLVLQVWIVQIDSVHVLVWSIEHRDTVLVLVVCAKRYK